MKKILLLLFSFLTITNFSSAQVSQSEFDALVALYNATDGPNWYDNTGWSTTTNDVSDSWHGITVSDGHITEIDLSFNSLNGTIPIEIGNLTNISLFKLRGNQLSGNIPSEIGNLTNLVEIWIGNNQLSGNIPQEIGNLTNLLSLYMGGNLLNGNIPQEIGNLSNLEILGLSNNQLSGNIPIEIGNLSNLTVISFQSNQLSGNIPLEIGNLANLTNFALSNNQIIGSIPPEIGNLSKLELIDFSDNQISGNIPHEIGKLNNLTNIWLSGNLLSGNIPPEIGNLNNLTFLNLRDNQLNGNIPTEIGNLINLTDIWLSVNKLNGNIPPEVGNLTNLLNIVLGNNQLSGNIPPQIGNLTNLVWLELSSNQLSGNIPSEIGDLEKLTGLRLSGNQLTGNIPTEIGNLTNLTELYLDNNQLSGNFPTVICNLTNLWSIDLSGNNLNGSIPTEIGNLTDLQGLNLGHNQFIGNIPIEIGKLKDLISLDLSDNKLIGNIPFEILKFGKLIYLSLNSNQFTGNIPQEMGNLTNLIKLNLSKNKLSGNIPFEFGNLTKLEQLDLSYNQLNGNFSNLTEITFLSSYNITNNYYTFNNFETNIPLYFNLEYIPQLNFPVSPSDIVLDTGGNINLDATTIATYNLGGANNLYEWFLNGVSFGDKSASPVYSKNNISENDMGVYTCKVTNTAVPDLTLTSEDIRLGRSIVYSSSTVLQLTEDVFQGATQQQIIGIEIKVDSIVNPLYVSSFNFNTAGTTNTADISNARLYYEAPDNQFGSAVSTPIGAFTISGSQDLSEGSNYFWLVYDINSDATLGNSVDAECVQVNIGGVDITPTVTAPAGARQIIEEPRISACGNAIDYGDIVPNSGSWQNIRGKSGERAFWMFNAEENVTYAFSSCTASQDTYLRIYDESSNLVYENNDDGPYCSGAKASVNWLNISSGNYYILLTDNNCEVLSSDVSLEYKILTLNSNPMVDNPIDDIMMNSDFSSTTLDLSNVFSDADNDALTFTAVSDNTSVINVSIEGTILTITEAGIGSSNIKVTANDGKGGTVEDIFKIKVNEAPNNDPTVVNPIVDITLADNFGTNAIDLAHVFNDAEGDQLTFTVTSSNNDVVTVSLDGTTLTITEVGAGTSDILITVNDGKGGTVKYTFSVKVSVNTGIEELVDVEIKIYPNPTDSKIKISINKDFKPSDNWRISLCDISGRTVISRDLENKEIVFDLSNQAKGIYYIQLENGDDIYNHKIVVH